MGFNGVTFGFPCASFCEVSTWDTKSSKVNIFQVARAIKRPPWGSQYDVSKRVENDETIKILACLTFLLQFVETATRKNPATRHQVVIFLGGIFGTVPHFMLRKRASGNM